MDGQGIEPCNALGFAYSWDSPTTQDLDPCYGTGPYPVIKAHLLSLWLVCICSVGELTPTLAYRLPTYDNHPYILIGGPSNCFMHSNPPC